MYKFIIFGILVLVTLIIIDNLKNMYIERFLDLDFWKEHMEKKHMKIIEFIEKIKIHLNKFNIKYWSHAGTLLGIIRHQQIIPWDDDVDLGFVRDDNVFNFIDELKYHGYKVENAFYGFKIIDPNDKDIFIDMFEFNLDPTTNMYNQNAIANFIWPKENYPKEELFPLKDKKLFNISLPCPFKSEKFCERAYTPKYMDEFYIQSPHKLKIFNVIDSFGFLVTRNNKFYIKDLYSKSNNSY